MTTQTVASRQANANSVVVHRASWEDLREIIRTKRLEKLIRTPEDLAYYLKWKEGIHMKYESIEKYIILERLKWTLPVKPESLTPFQCNKDWKTIKNDFPYYFEEGIEHLVIWLKFQLDQDSDGVLTDAAVKQINDFTHSKFNDTPQNDLLWFVNTKDLRVCPK